MSCINIEHSFGGRHAKLVRLVPGERLHQNYPASGENSNNIPASSLVSEQNLGVYCAILSNCLVTSYVSNCN